jgi:hypothetical protein
MQLTLSKRSSLIGLWNRNPPYVWEKAQTPPGVAWGKGGVRGRVCPHGDIVCSAMTQTVKFGEVRSVSFWPFPLHFCWPFSVFFGGGLALSILTHMPECTILYIKVDRKGNPTQCLPLCKAKQQWAFFSDENLTSYPFLCMLPKWDLLLKLNVRYKSS